MKLANATKLNRKSGVAEWTDLLFLFRFSRRLFSRALLQRLFNSVGRARRTGSGTTFVAGGAKSMVGSEAIPQYYSELLSLWRISRPNLGAVFVPVTFTGISAPAPCL